MNHPQVPFSAAGRLALGVLFAAAALVPGRVWSGEAASANYRLIGSAPASTSGVTSSPTYTLYVVGGSGEAVGISASANSSVVSGGSSTQLPTDSIFKNSLE